MTVTTAALGTDCRAIFNTVIDRLLNGDMKDKRNAGGWTYVEQLAHDMFADPKMAAKLTATAGLPGVKASLKRAAALNAPKLALLATAEQCKTRGATFRLDLPHRLLRLHHSTDEDPRYGEHVYLPLNRSGVPLGEEAGWRGCYDRCDASAWHFRRDPNEIGVLIDDDSEIEGGWPPGGRNYLYITDDLHGMADSVFLSVYRDRLRRVLAEAVPGVGGLSTELW